MQSSVQVRRRIAAALLFLTAGLMMTGVGQRSAEANHMM